VILGIILLLLLFPILRLVFGLAGWLLGIIGTLLMGVIVLVAFAALFKFFIVAAVVVGGLWASKAIFS